MAETTTPAKSETKTEAKRDNQLSVDRVMLLEYTTTLHSVTVEVGTQLADLERPDFWAHVAAKFRPFDELTIRADDGSWWAKALVLTVGRAFAKVKIIQHVPLTTSDVDQTTSFEMEGHSVVYRGAHLKWCVVRKKDNMPIREKCESFEEARVWLTEFVGTPLA